jgi:chromosome segregation ATPase
MGLLLNRYVIIGVVLLVVVGGGAAYGKISADMIRDLREQVGALTEQTKELQATNQALIADFSRVQRAQQDADRKLENIRLTAIQAMRQISARTYDTHDIPALQQQVNKDMADVLQRLATLGHAP